LTKANSDQLLQIWEREYERVVRVAKRRVRDAGHAEDIAMTAFSKLGEAMERRPVPDPARLLEIILFGLIADVARKAPTRAKEVLTDELFEPGVQASFTGVDFPAVFDNAVRGLEKPERDAFILTELRGLTLPEAAGVLNIARSTLALRDKAAREALRKELA
jgi:RNA polymerase sigma factor (sigma-70 family)